MDNRTENLRLHEALTAAFGEGIVECHDSLNSTQTRAHELARGGAPRALVVAREQTAGRGRLTRHWESPKGGGIYFSILFRPVLPPSEAHLVNIAAALSVSEAIRSTMEIETALKWPNDLLLSYPSGETGGKVCGILSESAFRGASLDYCITGIGINFYEPKESSPAVKTRAGGLRPERTGPEDTEEPDAAALLSRVVRIFFERIGALERGESARLLKLYREKCASVGRTVTVETDSETLTGLCSGIGDEGELVVETPGGTERRFHVADITHARLK
ncbi:MAG: biotin--[acetyl-CoA-carboxylase] ligase [Synergistaceae bacterium]|nr:biotin--[acetyl-CoA-carboxylase] ligase [Synergistaceae bacterium]